jgi:hypothetical protein
MTSSAKRGRVVPAPGSFYSELLAVIEEGIERTPPPDRRDFDYWLDALDDQHNRAAVRFLLRELERSVRRGASPVRFAELGRLAPHAPDLRARRLWKTLAALAAAIGERPTRYLLASRRAPDRLVRAVRRGASFARRSVQRGPRSARRPK